MKLRNSVLFLMSIGLLSLMSCRMGPAELSLAGEWQFALDPEDIGVKQEWQNKELGETLRLPGS